jgi:hypothetical protein
MTGRRTPLYVDKELVRLWYEFYRLALQSNDRLVISAVRRSRHFYKDWEVEVTEKFDSWWVRHKRLFERRGSVRILAVGDTQSADTVLLEIPLNIPRTDALTEIRSVLPSVIPTRPKKSCSPGMYLTTEVQGVKRDSLRIMLDLERRIFRNSSLKGSQLRERVQKFFNEERYQRKKNRVPASFFIDTYADSTENVDRNIRRYRQKVKQLILNVANGEFPGKY